MTSLQTETVIVTRKKNIKCGYSEEESEVTCIKTLKLECNRELRRSNNKRENVRKS